MPRTRIELLKEIIRQRGACNGINCFDDDCPLQGKCHSMTSDLALAKELLAEETSDDIDFLSEIVRQEGYGETEKHEAGDYVRCIKKTELEADSCFNPSMREMLDGEYRKILKTTESHDGTTARIHIEGIGDWFWHLSDLEFITAEEYEKINEIESNKDKFAAGNYVRCNKSTWDEVSDNWVHEMKPMLDGKYRRILRKIYLSDENNGVELQIEGIDGIDDGGWYYRLCDLEVITAEEYNSLYKKCDLKKDDPVEVSDDGEHYDNDFDEKFYDYDATLAKPFVTVDRDGDMRNHKYCRKVRTDYEPYTEFDPAWRQEKVKTQGDDEILTIIGHLFPDKSFLVLQDDNGICYTTNLEHAFCELTWADGRKFGKEVK